MRRLAALFLCGILFLTACSSESVTPVVSGFRCRVEMTYDGQTASAVLDRTDSGVTTLLFDAPSALDGVAMQWNGEKITLQYAGMELAVENDRIPVGAAVKVLCEALEQCASHTGERYEGEASFGEYVIVLDASSGYPLTLECESLALTVCFSEWEQA